MSSEGTHVISMADQVSILGELRSSQHGVYHVAMSSGSRSVGCIVCLGATERSPHGSGGKAME